MVDIHTILYYGTLSVWLQLRDLIREAGLVGMSVQSRSLSAKSILDRYMDLEPSSDTESEREFEHERAELSDSSSVTSSEHSHWRKMSNVVNDHNNRMVPLQNVPDDSDSSQDFDYFGSSTMTVN